MTGNKESIKAWPKRSRQNFEAGQGSSRQTVKASLEMVSWYSKGVANQGRTQDLIQGVSK